MNKQDCVVSKILFGECGEEMQLNRLNRVSYIGQICFRNGCDYRDPETKEKCVKIDSRPYELGVYCFDHRCEYDGCVIIRASTKSKYCEHHIHLRNRNRASTK